MSGLDVASALFLLVGMALLLLDELGATAWLALRRTLAVLWVALAIAFVAKVASVLAPILRGFGS